MGIEDVNLDEKIETMDTPETAPEVSTEKEPTLEAKETPEASAVFDLGKASKFLYQGKEWTPQELEKAMLRQQDYSKKTMALAEERKFSENLGPDLRAIKSNPALAEQFKRIYPEKYHGYLDLLGIAQQQEAPKQNGFELPREVLEKLEKVDRIEASYNEKEKETFNAKLDAIETGMIGKYKYANLTDVYGAADAFFEKNGVKAKDVNQQMIEPFFKASHEHNQKQFQGWQKEQTTKAKETNDRAGDIGRGGGTPGQAPKRMRLNDVEDEIIRSF